MSVDRFIFHDNLKYRLEAVRLSSLLLSSSFSSTISHPKRAVDHENYTPAQLLPGQELFLDQHHVNTYDALEGTKAVCHALLDTGMALEALPVLSIYEHISFHIVKDIHAVFDAQISR